MKFEEWFNEELYSKDAEWKHYKEVLYSAFQAGKGLGIDEAVKVVVRRAEPHSFEEQCLEHVAEEIKQLKEG